MAKKDWMRSAAVGPHFAICMAIGYLMGNSLDKWLSTNRVFTVIFLLFGTAAGFLYLFKELQIVNREEEEKAAEDAAQQSEAGEVAKKAEEDQP